MTLGEVIKAYREKAGESMEVFANRCSLSKGYISMLERGINPRNDKPIAPTLPVVRKVAEAMGMSIDGLLEVIDGKTEITINMEKESDIKLKNVHDPSLYGLPPDTLIAARKMSQLPESNQKILRDLIDEMERAGKEAQESG